MEETEVVVLEKPSVAALEGRVQEPDQGHDRLRGRQGVGGPGQVKNVLHQITVELITKTIFTTAHNFSSSVSMLAQKHSDRTKGP